MLVAKDLDLYVARAQNEFLDENTIIAECCFRFGLNCREAFADFCVVISNADTFTATASRRFDHNRIADLARDAHSFFSFFDQAHMAWNCRNACFGSEFFRGDLVTHGFDRERVRADEGDFLFFKAAGKYRVLGEETKTRVNSFCAGLANSVDDLVLNQIRF